jgi:hypothetical protein
MEREHGSYAIKAGRKLVYTGIKEKGGEEGEGASC